MSNLPKLLNPITNLSCNEDLFTKPYSSEPDNALKAVR